VGKLSWSCGTACAPRASRPPPHPSPGPLVPLPPEPHHPAQLLCLWVLPGVRRRGQAGVRSPAAGAGVVHGAPKPVPGTAPPVRVCAGHCAGRGAGQVPLRRPARVGEDVLFQRWVRPPRVSVGWAAGAARPHVAVAVTVGRAGWWYGGEARSRLERRRVDQAPGLIHRRIVNNVAPTPSTLPTRTTSVPRF
jgi:hypothetical protein